MRQASDRGLFRRKMDRGSSSRARERSGVVLRLTTTRRRVTMRSSSVVMIHIGDRGDDIRVRGACTQLEEAVEQRPDGCRKTTDREGQGQIRETDGCGYVYRRSNAKSRSSGAGTFHCRKRPAVAAAPYRAGGLCGRSFVVLQRAVLRQSPRDPRVRDTALQDGVYPRAMVNRMRGRSASAVAELSMPQSMFDRHVGDAERTVEDAHSSRPISIIL